MKRFALNALLAAGALVIISGCGGTQSAGNNQIRTGLGIDTSIASSRSASADADGQVQVDSSLVAVTVGQDGKITTVSLDVAQTRVGINAQGEITSDLTVQVPSKLELGEGYGMRPASPIGREWFEQAGAFAGWMVGQTPRDVLRMGVNEENRPTGDLAASVTVHVDSYLAALAKATDTRNLRGGDLQGAHTTGLGVVTTIDSSKPATEEADGLVQVDSYVAALTMDENGIITMASIDAAQTKVNFDAQGQITTDLNSTIRSKLELGDDYGMRRASPIGKEWFEQSQAFTSWMVGKTPAQVLGMQLNDGYAAEADLTASVTIHVDGMLIAVERAAANAR